MIALHLTEAGINLKLGRLILFYVVCTPEQHCYGWRWWNPDHYPADRHRVYWLGEQRRSSGIR